MRLRKGITAVLLVLALASGHAVAQERRHASATVAVAGDATRAELVIAGDLRQPAYAVRAENGGTTLVVDVSGVEAAAGAVTTGASPLVRRSVASTSARGLRVEVDLARPVAYRTRFEDGRIVVSFEALDAAAPGDGAAGAPQDATPGSARGVDGLARVGAVTVHGARIERREGRDRVVVELERGVDYRVLPDVRGRARLLIPGARLGDGAPTEVRGDDRGRLRSLTLRDERGGIVVEADRRDGVVATPMREGARIVWIFADGERSQNRARSRTVTREAPLELDEIETGDVAGFLSDLPLQVRDVRATQRYSGRRIDLDFKDADVHNILRLLAEVGGVNIVTSDDVSGTVTIRMRNVPWDQALDVILQAKSLGMVRRGNLIRVAPLTTLEKERELALARRKQSVELAPLETRIVPVSYATAGALQARARELLSARGSVSVDERTNVLIVRDIVDNLDDVEELVRTLDTQTPQVLVEARIVEATSQYVRDIGIQWGGDVTAGTATGNPTGLLFPSNVGLTGGNFDNQTPTNGLSPFLSQGQVPNPNFAVNLPATVGTGQGGALGLTLGSIGGNVNLNVRLSAAEANGNLRIVSSPRILTLDNYEAHIAQGTLIPYSQVSAQGVQTAFQEAKLELRVRPHVTSDGSVAMHVRITRDEPDFTRTSARGDPTILKREAETDLLVEDGHTAVIGGIYTRTAGRNRDQIPFFGDIPILGVLFQRRRVRDERSELLIFLTPRIVNRSDTIAR
jgi:type IV pilus assembly protein PilQ